MLISVIVPVFCVEQYLEECIKSIISQSFADFELLLVVDGSTDGSESICKRYSDFDKRIKFFVKENEGPLLARKYALQYAKGDYLIFIDGDDYVEQGYFETVASILKDFNPDIICFGYNEVRDFSKKTINGKNMEGIYKKQDLLRFLDGFIWDAKKGNISNTGTLSYSLWDKVFKKSIFLDIICNVNEKIRIGEDLLCCLFYLNRCDSLFLSNKCFYNYRIVSTSLINSYVTDNSTHFNNTIVELSKITSLQKEKISIYSYHIFLYIVAKLARQSTNYNVFKTEIQKVYDCKEMYNYLLAIDYKKCTLIERLKLQSLKSKKLTALYFAARLTQK